ncbi:hypothetical protein [Methanobrevibacter sp.]|uniref:portal protein n=1 Tax=Methanobrevibacter sp. TaxID=66852 RepID=UPI003D7C61EA
MKLNIETLQDTFKFGYEQFEESRAESNLVMDLYHNRQYNQDQLNILARRGQPAETFNVIKTFSRLLLGYYSTIVNTVKIVPKQQDDIVTAGVLNDIVDYIFKQNNFVAEAEKIKLDLLLNGIMCSYVDVEELTETDEFNRPKFKINMQHVPIYEIVLDPMSMRDDYSDARFIHRFKWVSEETIAKIFGKAKLKELHEYENTLNQNDTEFDKYFRDRFVGYHAQYNAYLLVHSIMVDDDNKIWSVYWAGDYILDKREITYREVKNPYRIYRLHNNNVKAEYYGIFRDIIETQHAMNQALIKLQLLANAQKVFVQESSIDNLKEFSDAVNRVNAVIPVKDLAGVKVENLSQDVLEQYKIIDAALMRIQRILSVNDSFLGMAYASDSGSKVEIQQRASITALRYLTLAIEQFYRLLGWDIVCLIKQYYTFHDVIRIADQSNSVRWLEINRPQLDPMTGGPVMEVYRDPGSGKPAADENGQIILSPMPTKETDIEFTEADIEVESVAYNDEIDKNRLIIEQFLSGPIGQMLSQANPIGFFQISALAMKETKTKYSMEIASILEQTAMGMSQMQQQMMATGNAVGQERPKSTSNATSGK